MQTYFMPSDNPLCLPLSRVVLILCKTHFVPQMKDASVKIRVLSSEFSRMTIKSRLGK